MSTANDVIRRALKLLGVLGAGESLGADDAADGLVELNLLLGSWANERLLVFGSRRNTYTLTPNLSPHTIGASGTFATTRPLRIDGAGVIMPGTTAELPINLLTDSEYQSITDKTVTSQVPTRLWMEDTYPNANLWFWPVPTLAATLALYTWSRVAAFAANDTVSLPDGYENALGHALAMQMAPMYGVEPSAKLEQNTLDAVGAIKRTNAPDVVSEIDAGVLTNRPTFNILTG